MDLEALGFAADMADAVASLDDDAVAPARVVTAGRERYRLLGAAGATDAALGGRLRHVAESGDLPVVGDWVAARLDPAGGDALVVAVLPRRTVLVRKHPDRGTEPQVLAANVDRVFVVSSLDRDFSVRRIERALAMIHEGGAEPVVLLTKRDLCDDPESHVAEIRAIAPGVSTFAVSATRDEGLEEVRRLVERGQTAVLVGSSGVGKSTLLNWFFGEARAVVGATRQLDDKGRHTTTARELFVLDGGGMIIDTPGMRELGLWDAGAGLASAFDDIEALQRMCKFGNCRHAGEPGCAVAAAIADHSLDPERLAAYEKLQREVARDARKVDSRTMSEFKRGLKRVFRERKRALKNSDKR